MGDGNNIGTWRLNPSTSINSMKSDADDDIALVAKQALALDKSGTWRLDAATKNNLEKIVSKYLLAHTDPKSEANTYAAIMLIQLKILANSGKIILTAEELTNVGKLLDVLAPKAKAEQK